MDPPVGLPVFLSLPSARLASLHLSADSFEEPLLSFLLTLGQLSARCRVYLFHDPSGVTHESLAACRLGSLAAAGTREIVPISTLAFRALARSNIPEPLRPWNVWEYTGRYSQFPPPPPRWLNQPLPLVGLSFRARTGHERSGTQFNRLVGPGSAPGCLFCDSHDGSVLHLLLDCLAEPAEDLRLALSPSSPIDDLPTLRVLLFTPDFLSRAAELLAPLGFKW
jgi:hypothetical protein